MVTNKPPIDGTVSPRDKDIYDCFIEAANELTNVTFTIANGNGRVGSPPKIDTDDRLVVLFFTTSMDEYFNFRDANGQLSTHTGIAAARWPYCFR
ncbi:MAG: hypothetical protein LBU51_03110 [Bacteroidales bacterium]|jgi:hypothetical protein|nr:hypothetical protein [Bacteroidales bacterium]